MRKNKFFVALSACSGVLFPTIAHADCNDILRYVNYNVTKNYQSLNSEQINDANFCSADFNSASETKKASIKASYGLFSGGAAGSDEQIKTAQSQKCANKYGASYLSKLDVASTEVVSPEAMNAVISCQTAQSFKLTSLTSQGNSFVAEAKWSGYSSTSVSRSFVSAPNGKLAADCSFTMPDGSPAIPGSQLPAGQSIIITCDRKSYQTTTAPNGEALNIYPAGIVTIATGAGAATIPLIQVSDSLVPNARLAGLESSNTQLLAEISALEVQLGDAKVKVDLLDHRNFVLKTTGPGDLREWSGGPNREKHCPSGSFMTTMMTGDTKDFRLGCGSAVIERAP